MLVTFRKNHSKGSRSDGDAWIGSNPIASNCTN